MPHSSSEDSDQQSLLSRDSIDVGCAEKDPQHLGSSSSFRQSVPTRSATRILAAVAAAAIILVVTIMTFTRLRSRSPPEFLDKHCGSTPDEALALGCKFDVLNYSWQPPECFDEGVYNRYWEKAQEHGPLRWYADSSFTRELPQDLELFERTPYVWTEHRFHVVHCMYGWELMHHALTLDKPVVEFISRFNHTMHCADTALDEDLEGHLTSIKASYNRCVLLDSIRP